VEWVVEAPQVMGILGNAVPFSTVNFRYLAAAGQARDVEGFTFHSGDHVATPSKVTGSSGQLISGFTVHWAPHKLQKGGSIFRCAERQMLACHQNMT
jgi:hypothetical protein